MKHLFICDMAAQPSLLTASGEEPPMCPAWPTTMVPISAARPERAETRSFPMIAAGTTSTGGLTALAMRKLRDQNDLKNRPTASPSKET